MMTGRFASRNDERLLSDTDVLVVESEVGAGISDGPAAARWPCPFCGLQRRLDSAVPIRIRNRTGPELARTAVACATCADRLLVPAAQDRRTRDPGLSTRPAGQGDGHPGSGATAKATDE